MSDILSRARIADQGIATRPAAWEIRESHETLRSAWADAEARAVHGKDLSDSLRAERDALAQRVKELEKALRVCRAYICGIEGDKDWCVKLADETLTPWRRSAPTSPGVPSKPTQADGKVPGHTKRCTHCEAALNNCWYYCDILEGEFCGKCSDSLCLKKHKEGCATLTVESQPLAPSSPSAVEQLEKAAHWARKILGSRDVPEHVREEAEEKLHLALEAVADRAELAERDFRMAQFVYQHGHESALKQCGWDEWKQRVLAAFNRAERERRQAGKDLREGR